MALYIPHSIFHLARLLYVRPETFGPYYLPFHVFVDRKIQYVRSNTYIRIWKAILNFSEKHSIMGYGIV